MIKVNKLLFLTFFRFRN